MKRFRILVLEERIEEAHIITRMLVKNLPCDVDIVLNVSELEENIGKVDYDVLIADVLVDGFDVERILKKLKCLKRRTLIYLFVPYFDESYMLELVKKGVHFPVFKSARSIEGVVFSIRNILETLWTES